MKIASIVVALAGVGLAGYAVSSHFGGSGPVAEVVRLPQRAGEPVVRTPPGEPQKATATPGDRASLTRELQRELQRVGCYDGVISGAWTTSARMAMKAFTDRVNATLPVDAPDYILLSLVQRHPGKACGTGCPSGQSPTEDGRCVPSAVLAKASKATAAWEPKPDEPKPADKAADKSADKPGAASTSWSPTAGQAAELRSPPIRGNTALVAPKGEPKPVPAEAREEGTRVAAAKSDAKPDTKPDAKPDTKSETKSDIGRPPEPAARETRTAKRAVRPDGPVPEVGIYEEQGRRKVRSAKSKPPKVVRKFLRSMQRSLAGLPW